MRALARLLAALGVPFNSYLLLGVPTAAVELPADGVSLAPGGAPATPPAVDPELAAALDRPVLREKFLSRRVAPLRVTITAISPALADAKGLVLTGSGRMVNPSLLDQAHLLGDWSHQVYRPRPVAVEGIVGNLSHRFQQNPFHWLFEILPRIAVFEAAGATCDRLYVSQQHRFQRESLELLGIESDRVLASDCAGVIQAERLLAVSHWDAFRDIPEWACDFLRARVPVEERQGGPDRIYVSRADAAGRRLLNEDELLSRLSRFGFQRIVLSELSMAEQVAIFRRAAVVVGPHGAGLSNAVFCRPGSWLVELSAPRYVFGCWFDLARKCDLRYSLVPARGMDFDIDHGWKHQREDFSVDVAEVVALLERGLG